MKKEDIYLYDWLRILIGEVPGTFYIEILIRAAAVYLILVVSMRLMGRRMASRLSRNEMAAMVSLAAAVGIPILDAQRGLLPVVVIALVVVFTQRLISYWAAKNEKFEGLTQGISSTLVENSVVQVASMKESSVTRELLFAQLRSGGIIHLGQVKRLYLEANGAFTLIKDPKPRPGLSLIPEWDVDFIDQQKKAPAQCVCYVCGHIQPKPSKPADVCPNCSHSKWIQALA
ncbi:DUF421 domain-containing protein [Spirosoma fluviale]|uniref:YetF C-terminal domain-containing protein n=1 Tax=Spirosoma fluviale TaxID=1597977 RepID=A0A286F7Y4_9BACT|nr:YetF domain-containing protein [Spirosoma fluviale]SOD79341.1 Protein of unknown function [Spirosoma fluviale]